LIKVWNIPLFDYLPIVVLLIDPDNNYEFLM